MSCEDIEEPVFKEPCRYVEIVGRIAEDFRAVLVPLEKMIDEQEGRVPPAKRPCDAVGPCVHAH